MAEDLSACSVALKRHLLRASVQRELDLAPDRRVEVGLPPTLAS